MSSTNESNPSIPIETWRGATLEDAVHSLKAVNPRKANKCRSSFSIEEILKPSFGAKTSHEIDNSQPLDMRTERNTAVKEALERDIVYMDVSSESCPFRSPSPDENSNSCSNSRDSSPDSRHYSGSENGDCHEYEELYQEHKSQFRESRVFSQHKDAMMESEDVHFLTPRSYYDTLSHVYGLNLHSIGSHLFYHLGHNKHSLIALSGSECLSNNYLCSSIYTNGSTNLKIIAANNTSQLRRSTQESTVDSFQSNSGHACDKPLAVKADSSSRPSGARKCAHSDDGPGDSKTNVQSDKKLISEDTICERSGSKPEVKFEWPAWVYCTRYSDRPSSGPRYRKPRTRSNNENDKRPRTAFSTQQLHRLRLEFESCPYLSETRRQNLALDLGLNESQVKIWFQNKRAKLKKSSGNKNQLAVRLMEEGLYNHSTIVVDDLGNKIDPRHDDSGRS